MRVCSASSRPREKSKIKESADKPGSVVDNHSSKDHRHRWPQATYPEAPAGAANASLFGLAPDGVYRAAACYHPRGALLPHLFTLT